MDFVKKYWYIVFGNFALPFLALHTLLFCGRANLPAWKVFGNFFFLAFIVMGIPTLIVQELTETAQSPLVRSLPILFFYLTGIFATYLHARFREKYDVSRSARNKEHQEL
jgi:hypothetical protein